MSRVILNLRATEDGITNRGGLGYTVPYGTPVISEKYPSPLSNCSINIGAPNRQQIYTTAVDLQGDFTIALWAMYMADHNRNLDIIIGDADYNYPNFTVELGDAQHRTIGVKINLYFAAGHHDIDSNKPDKVGEWVHLALTNQVSDDSHNWRFFVNGKYIGNSNKKPSTSNTKLLLAPAAEMYVDDVRIIEGECLYTSDFDPTSGVPTIAGYHNYIFSY